MTYPCDLVAERLALGEPLGADGDAHVASCPACARLVRLPAIVAATAREPAPGPGFAVRMQVGARAELSARRRNRVASLTLATAAAVLIGGVFMTRHGHRDAEPTAIDPFAERQPISTPGEHRPEPRPQPDRTASHAPVVADDHLLAHLVHVADIDGALRPRAPWRRIEAPLAPYHQLLVHVSQGAR